ncbi:MAG: EAL domain-containing protein [Deltaproteobacteria bacterium]|nr:EAL domain-containing protein [Deltaproteobacteria bacterium]
MSQESPSADAKRESIALLLVVEDDPTANRLTEVLARPDGLRYDITRVLRVEDALRLLTESHFDAMLLDISLHEGPGLDSLMRASAATGSIPVVVLTYQRDEATTLKAARAGAQDCLSRGEVTPELISRTILHAIERHKILQQLTEAKQRQRFLATHDTLTELPNRYSFMQQLGPMLHAAKRRGTKLAVLFFDLDGFKAINDNLGHGVGDELLTDVAKRLRKAIRKCDLIARIGGDEFLAAIQDVEHDETTRKVAEGIRREIERPYHLDGHECWISASIGISFFPHHGEHAEQLIQNADTAMYQAKGSGKNRVCLFSDDMNDKSAERFELVSGLREAVHSGQLQLMFQPQVDVSTEEIVGVETLVRWHHPTRGIVSPANFIGVAEDAGVMVQLGEWVLRSACEAARSWAPHSNARVAVNLSGRQLDHPDFPKRVKKILYESELPASRLELELTESLATSDSAMRVIAELRALGIRVAIDDFGTGYSSLTLLKRLKIDLLKIDQSFVRGAAQTDPDRVILAAIIQMARGLGLDVLAEGVENPEEMKALLERGCTRMQGYLFSKPVDKNQLDWLVSSPDAPWRAVLADPEAWAPVDEPAFDALAGPVDGAPDSRSAGARVSNGSGAVSAASTSPAAGEATGRGVALGRLGLRSGSCVDPDEDLYPVLKNPTR